MTIIIKSKMQNYLLQKNKTIKEALLQLEKNREKCLVIVHSTNVLMGALTEYGRSYNQKSLRRS